MTGVCIVFAIAAIIGFGMAVHYRQQIKSITEQLSFLNQHETNMIITGAYGTGCVTDLIEQLNTMIDQTAALRKESADSELCIKDTIINLSHDIRTPLTSLEGYFQLFQRSEQPEEQQQYAAIINSRLLSLKEMLDELFTYAKLTNKTYDFELAPCHIKEILFRVVFSFYEDFKRGGMEPRIDIPEDDIIVLANEAALGRIFQNILKNSLEHGKKKISIQSVTEGSEVRFRFINDYIPTNPIDTEKIFDRFYKADDARSKASTGLGLSIAKELVLRMNGSISGTVCDDTFIIEISFPIQ